MLRLAPWIERIAAEVPALRAVGGAADLSAIQRGVVAAPSAWIIPVAETARDSETVSIVSQRVNATVGIVIAVSNLRDARGAAAQDGLADIRIAIREALLGWAPDADHDPATFARGRLLSLSDQVLWWQDEYFTGYHMRTA